MIDCVNLFASEEFDTDDEDDNFVCEVCESEIKPSDLSLFRSKSNEK